MSGICDKAHEKLSKEEGENKESASLAGPIVNFILSQCDDNEEFSGKVNQDHKTLKKCIDYITEKARKQLDSNNGAIDSDTVFAWALEYYNLDDTEIEAKKAADAKKRDEDNKKRQAESEAARKQREQEKKVEKAKAKQPNQISFF